MKYTSLPLLFFAIICAGCSSEPSKHTIEEQLNKYQVFAEPETWYVCLGTLYVDEIYEASKGCRFAYLSRGIGIDSQALQLGLTALTDEGQGSLDDCSPSSSGTLVCRGADPSLGKVVLTDKGRKYLQAPGSIVKDNEAAFVVAHFRVLKITEVHREGPDSVVANLEWQQQPTEIGRLFEPTMGLHTHIAKALFRMNENKEWILVSPDQTTSDPHYREFSIYSQVFEAIDKESKKKEGTQ